MSHYCAYLVIKSPRVIRNATDPRVCFKKCRLLQAFTAALATYVVLIVDNSNAVFYVTEAGCCRTILNHILLILIV